MGTVIAIIWTIAIIAAIVCPIFFWWRLWKQFRALLHDASDAIGTILDTPEYEPEPLSPLRGPGPLGADEDLVAARQMRVQVFDVRATRKRARLDAAVERWSALGLVRKTDS